MDLSGAIMDLSGAMCFLKQKLKVLKQGCDPYGLINFNDRPTGWGIW